MATELRRLQHIAADIILLDQLLAEYGEEAKPARDELRRYISPLVDRIWGDSWSDTAHHSTFTPTRAGEATGSMIFALAPQNEAQRVIKDRAIQTASDLAQTRFLLFEQSGGAIPLPFLIVLIFWLAIIFMSFGLFSRLNLVSGIALIVFAVSAAGALFLVLELSNPFAGLMQISSAPLRNALAPL
jgi:Protein of unknown function (DUF4239)